MKVFEPNKDFDFSKVYLDTPQPTQGGSFFTKLLTGDGNPLFIQLPVSMSKQGIVTTKKNKYCDLLYDKDNQESLIGWILALEEHCQKNIYDKSDHWFHNDFSRDDIDSLMTPVYRLYNSGKKLLVRTYIDVGRENKQHKCVVYDEREVQTSMARIMAHTSIVPLVLIEGVKFSSKNFDIVIKLTQAMVLDDEPDATTNCLIRRTSSKVSTPPSNETQSAAPVEEPEPQSAAPVEETNKSLENTSKQVEIVDIDIDIDMPIPEGEPMNLRKPNEIHYELYQAAKVKAVNMRKAAVEAYLETKKIKTKYMLDDIEDSDEDSDDDSIGSSEYP